MTALLIVVAISFAWSIGAHYTGRRDGHAARAPRDRSLAGPPPRRTGSGLTRHPLSVSEQAGPIAAGYVFGLLVR